MFDHLDHRYGEDDLNGEELWTAKDLGIPVLNTEDGKIDFLRSYFLHSSLANPLISPTTSRQPEECVAPTRRFTFWVPMILIWEPREVEMVQMETAERAKVCGEYVC